MAQHYLPEEVIADILKRLPVKSLLRFTCIEKSWYSLIHTSQFITLHSNHQKTRSDNNKHLIFHYISSKSLSIRFDDEACCEYYAPEFPSTLMNPRFHGVSNGLICFSSYKDMSEKECFKYNIHIWNPAIRKYITLPPYNIDQDRLAEVLLAIGFFPKFNDYKVVKVEILRLRLGQKLYGRQYSVYSLSTNSWKTISHKQSQKLWGGYNMVFVNGAVFSIVRDLEKGKRIIVCVDMENDVVCEISLPKHSPRFFNCSLEVYGESLAFFNVGSRIATMWIMEEGFSWKKKICVSMDDSYYWHITGTRNNGDLVLLRNEGKLAFYNIEEETRKFVDTSNIWNRYGKQPVEVSPFMESLIGLNTFLNY